ncbi:hypothetical protein [Bacillus sp. AFS018417]|uniref:hypothetical protein n=1 Tax=Bacillus sp. AFS018417 TaxID=2033491 RepID=UPI001596BEDC|nr:hypothetical protein [Bacillus sp. AFS018417]
MASLTHIQKFVDSCAKDLAEVLGLDVTLLDEHGTRISEIRYYQDLIGKRIPEELSRYLRAVRPPPQDSERSEGD